MRVTVRQLRQLVTESIGNNLGRDISRILGLDFMNYVGSGAYSTAFTTRDSKTGKDLVVKISSNPSEYVAYEKVRILRKTLPPDIAKHLPIVYLAQKIGNDPKFDSLRGDHSKLDQVSVMVVELLKPLPRSVRDQLFYDQVSTDEEHLHVVVKKCLDLMLKVAPWSDGLGGQALLGVFNRQALENMLLKCTLDTVAGQNKRNQIQSSSYISNQIWKAFSDQIMKRVSLDQHPNFVDLLADLRFTFGRNFNDNFASREIEAYAPKDRLKPSTALGVSILKAFSVLKGAGLQPKDTHAGNFMIRPSTGDVVFSDVGLFGDGE